ncbi:LENG9-like protein [Mya arenaria]|uniref:LENG9-like protein n=1 Tax=Mya arenaria TaxID=6604 RepID=A0ABY7FZ95_MYAAR|nr:leukocyte receptor cluster member 9-like [Mya arenaria]WAR26146.1 LENG9-like protein [Mya arenaria]
MEGPKETSTATIESEKTKSMEAEIEDLTSTFQGQCKVLESNGKFQKTVKLHPEHLDIVFNFKLTNTYPTTPAVIEVRSSSLDADEIGNLQAFIKQTAQGADGKSMGELVESALEWLKDGHINVSGARSKKKSPPSTPNKFQKPKARKKKPKDEVDKGKKPPMKTAIDVVKRILWDEALQSDQFLVGYMDRIDGLKEKYFNAFSWEDIASVDYTVLAIPKHRIQYFKYKDTIVWDKRCRLDNVFGSTGGKKTIVDVISEVDGPQMANGNNNDAHDDNGEGQANSDSDYYDSDGCSDSDSDSDDGITVTVGTVGIGAVGGAGYLADEADEIDDCEGENDDDTKGHDDKYWRDKLRPNYFIALRITDEELRANVEKIQDQVIQGEPKLRQCKIPQGALHVTLCTVGLDTEDQVKYAVDCLKEAQKEFSNMIPKGLKLRFKGVETFFNRVIYGRVVDCPTVFLDFVEHLKTCLTSKGIDIRDYHEFVPHMTLMKVSRPVAKMTGNNYIAPWLYSSYNETELGSQAVDNMSLCSMKVERQEDGFYMTAVSLDI